MKRCTKCHKKQDIECFLKNKAYRGGYSTWCRKCHADGVKRSYRKHREKKLKYYKEHRQRPEVKAKRKIYQKEYQSNNRKKLNKLACRYRSKNKEMIKAIDRKMYGKRKRQKRDTDLTVDYLVALKLKTKKCSLCGDELIEKNVHLDHIIPLCVNGSHTMNNVRYICAKCNLSRPIDCSDLVGHQLSLI